MRHADEMIITTAGGSTVITDQALIREMADYTVVSNHIGTRCFAFGDNCIEIYRGERLVRSMPQSSWVDGCWGDSPFAAYRRVEIFENDARHRITGNKQAYAHLPVEYLERLEAELNRQGNSFFPSTAESENDRHKGEAEASSFLSAVFLLQTCQNIHIRRTESILRNLRRCDPPQLCVFPFLRHALSIAA